MAHTSTKPARKKQRDCFNGPMDEPQTNSVGVKLGDTHYDALGRWARERFGTDRNNLSAILRMVIHEHYEAEQAERAEKPEKKEQAVVS